MKTFRTTALSALFMLAAVLLQAQAVFWSPAPPPFSGTMVPISKNTTTALQMVGTYMYNWKAVAPAVYNASAMQQIDTVTLTYCGAPTPYGQQVFLTKVVTVPTGAQNPSWQNSTSHGPDGIKDILTLNSIAPIPGTTLQGLVHIYDPGTPVPWSVCIVRIDGHWITHVWNNANQDVLFPGTSNTTVTIPR